MYVGFILNNTKNIKKKKHTFFHGGRMIFKIKHTLYFICFKVLFSSTSSLNNPWSTCVLGNNPEEWNDNNNNNNKKHLLKVKMGEQNISWFRRKEKI